MYATPWGRAMSMRQQGLKAAAKVAGVSAAAISLDKLFDNLATTGEVNPKDAALNRRYCCCTWTCIYESFCDYR